MHKHTTGKKRTRTDFAQVMSSKIRIAMKVQQATKTPTHPEETESQCARYDSKKTNPESVRFMSCRPDQDRP